MAKQDKKTVSSWSVIKRTLVFAMPHKLRFVAAFALLAVAVSAEMLIPWLAKIIIDDVIVPQQFKWQQLAWLVGGVMASYVVAAVFTYWQALLFRHSALVVVNKIRSKLFSHILHFSIGQFDTTPTGKLVSYITNDTEAMRTLFVSTLPTIVQGSLRIVAIFIAIALLDWRLMVLSLVLIPILLMIMHWYRVISMPVFDGVREQVSNINGRINESLQGMAVVQAFGQERTIKAKFAKDNQAWFDFRTRSIAIDSLMLIPLTRLVSTITAAGIVTWFALGDLSGQSLVAVGTLFAFLSYIERFFDPFRQLSMELRKLQVATVSSTRVMDLLDEPTEHQRYPEQAVKLTQDYDIEFNNVSSSYEPNKPVLSEVSFIAKAGQFTAIVGHTGSGKSSIINLLMRFYQHQQGEITVAGKPLEQLSERQLRAMFGLVSQDPTIFSGSMAENIDLSPSKISQARAQAAAKQVKADEFIRRLNDGYQHQPSVGGSSLSVGEKQLVALARVIAHDPHVYLLDEATANIDSDTELTIKNTMENIQQGKTVISVAHRLSTIKNADQILVMNQGKIVQHGTHQELIAQDGDYRNLYLAQQKQQQSQKLTSSLGLNMAQELN